MANLLYLVHRLPYPPNKGDKVRSYHLLRHLLKQGHRVFLGTFVDDPEDEQHVAVLRSLCAGLHVARLDPRRAKARSLGGLLSGQALTVHYYRDASLRHWVAETLASQAIDAALVFSSSMAQYAPRKADLPMLVDLVDVDSAKWAEYADAHRWPMSWLYRREARALLAYERQVVARSVDAFLVTAREVALFNALAPETAGRVHVLSNGVDADYFKPDPDCPSPFQPGEIPLVFTGAMDYWPNVDAVSWFAHEVLPSLRRNWPQLRLHIVGRSPTAVVQALANDAVCVSGTVADVRPYLQHAAAVVAPLRLARGLQNKVLEAMAMARPVVAALPCVQALDARDGEHLLSAQHAADYVHAIDALLRDTVHATAVGRAGRQRVLDCYGWTARLDALDHRLAGDCRQRSSEPALQGKLQSLMNPHLLGRSLLPAPWRLPGLALLAMLSFVLLLYRPTAEAMVGIWLRSETFAHAFVVPPISLWLAWRLRDQVLAQTPKPAPWVLLPMAGICLVWLSGELVSVAAATQFALVALLVLTVPALLGWQVTWTLAFPLGFLFFSVPAGEFLTPTLMYWTAEFTVAALRFTGIPVYQEGLRFVIPSGSWSVVEACSGIRYLIASVMVGTLFAYLNYRSTKRRLIFVGISIVVPLFANWLRAYMIVMLGHLSSNTLAAGADHLVYGWVLFGIIIMILFWIGARWAQAPAALQPPQASPRPWPAGMGSLVAALAALVMLAPVWMVQRLEIDADQTPVTLTLPADLPGGWRQAEDPVPHWEPGFVNPSSVARSAYKAPDGSAVGVYVGYYRHQGGDRKLVSSVNQLVPIESRRWNQVSMSARNVTLASATMSVREGRLLYAQDSDSRRQQLRVWQTYWIDGDYVASDVQAKLLGAWARLRGRGDDSAVLLVFALDGEGSRAEASLSSFLSHALLALTVVLDTARRVSTAD